MKSNEKSFFLLFLILISLEAFSQKIESNEKQNFLNFLATSSLDYKDPECVLITKDFGENKPLTFCTRIKRL